MMDDRQRRKLLRGEVGSYGWALVIYYVLMNASVMSAAILGMVWTMIEGVMAGNPIMEADASDLAGNGLGYLVACALAVLFIRIWKGKEFWRGMWKSERSMSPGVFTQLLCLFVSGQMVFQICATIQEAVLNQFGLSALESMELATVNTDTFSMFLYMSLGAPVVEEIIFRGLILRGLEHRGKGFAILVSSILFGLFHGNVVQSPYAFVVGLVLGYTAMEYNILWAMVLHMVNNLVLGDTIVRLTQWMGENASILVVQGLIMVCSVAAVITLIRKRKQIGEYLRAAAIEWNCWWAFCSSPGIIVMFLLMESNAIGMLFL